MLEEGQRLILTGEFGYFFVEGNDVLAPEQSAITDRLEGLEHLLQNGETLMLEFIVEAADSFINGFSGDRCDGTILSGSFVAHADPPDLPAILLPAEGASAASAVDFSR